jgi:hypothetical protein
MSWVSGLELKFPVATNCAGSPIEFKVCVPGVTVIEVRVRTGAVAVEVMSELPETCPPPEEFMLATMVVDPGPTALSKPDDEMVATLTLLDVHVT